jgi:hypothetical protein
MDCKIRHIRVFSFWQLHSHAKENKLGSLKLASLYILGSEFKAGKWNNVSVYFILHWVKNLEVHLSLVEQ